MKYLLSFLAGSAVTTTAVVLAGGYHAGMIILGGILTLTLLIVGLWALGIPRVSRWLLAFHNANNASTQVESTYTATRPSRSANAGNLVTATERREEHQKQKRDSQRRRKVVSFEKPEMLHTVPQQVVSALTNLGCSITKAEQIVLGCTKPGDSFDELFRKAAACLNPRRAA